MAETPPEPKRRRFSGKRVFNLGHFFSKFPHLAESIFQQLDNVSLSTSRITNAKWCNAIDQQKSTWIRKLEQKIGGSIHSFPDTWKKLVDGAPFQYVKKIAQAAIDFESNGYHKIITGKQTPLHVMAFGLDLDLYKFVYE